MGNRLQPAGAIQGQDSIKSPQVHWIIIMAWLAILIAMPSAAYPTTIQLAYTTEDPVCQASFTPSNTMGSMRFFTNNTMEYTITLTNTGNVTDSYLLSFEQLDLTDHVILDVTIRDAAGNQIVQTPPLAPGESMVLRISLRIPPGTTPKTWNHILLTAESTQCDYVAKSIIRTYLYQGNHEPDAYDLEVTKFASPLPAYVDSLLTYTILVKNTGNHIDGQELVLTDVLPQGMDIISMSQPATYTNGDTIRWEQSFLEAGGEWSVDITVRLTCLAITNPIPNKVSVISAMPEDSLANNFYELYIDIRNMVPPDYTLPVLEPTYCVEDIYQTLFNQNGTYPYDDLTYLRPDYFIFLVGDTMLDIEEISSECVPPDYETFLEWTIDLGNNGETDLAGSGQLSSYDTGEGSIHFPVGENLITYTLTDSWGQTEIKQVMLIVRPRPDIQLP